jgi:two-component system sensor histidine kinase BaeS
MISIFILIFLVNFYLKKYFNEYSIRKQEEKNQQIVNLIKNQYHKDSSWNEENVKDIGIGLLEEGLIINLNDISGKTVWNAMEHNSGICEKMIKDIKDRMQSKYPSIQGNFSYKTYFLDLEKKPIGNLQIGYYSPFFYTESEFLFIDALNNLIIVITIGTLIISLGIGFVISRLLSIPIGNVITTTGRISKGLYNIRISKSSVIKEFQELINSINDLAGSLESQDKLRKRLTLDVSHELRTPLTTLQAHIEAMIDGIWKPSVDRLKSFHEEILRLNKLVDDLTTLSHYEHESVKLVKTAVDLKSFLSDTLSVYESSFASRKIRVEYRSTGINSGRWRST